MLCVFVVFFLFVFLFVCFFLGGGGGVGVYRRIDSQKTRFTVPLTRRPETNFSDRISDDISSQIIFLNTAVP